MENQKFYTFKEKLLLLILLTFSIISILFYLKFNTLAFPEHNIKLEITREQAARKSSDFLARYNINHQNYTQSTIFYIDNQTKTYLERELGTEQTAQLAKNRLAVWYFDTRFFIPLQKEEFTVSFLPNGRFVGYNREVEESAPGASIGKEQALRIANQFLLDKTENNPSDWSLISHETIQRQARSDQILILENKNFKAGDAAFRLQISLIGDQIGGYNEFLKIPETWLRQFETESSNNELAQIIAEAVMFVLFGLSIIIFYILKFRRNELRIGFSWRIIGITVIISLLANLNSLPLIIYEYPTTMDWVSFLGIQLFSGIFQSISIGFMVLLIISTAEALYREIFPSKLSLEYTLFKGITGKAVNKSIFIGAFTAIILFSYELLYYFLGKNIGIWVPAEINYSDAYSTLLPWIYPLLIGFIAAVMEEGIFRLYGIPFLKKYVKKTWIAVLITSVIWAFLHSNYPQTPWFARGIELTVIGIVFSIIFLRYGIIASVVSHYTFNALQTSLAFYSSQNNYIIISSFLVSLLPVLYGIYLLIKKWRVGFTVPGHNALNNAIHITHTKIEPPVPGTADIKQESYIPLSGIKITALSLCAVAGIFIYASLYASVTIQSIPVKITRENAIQIAENSLINRGIKLENYHRSITYTNDELDIQAIEYILEESGLAVLKRIYPEIIPTNSWSVRFFQPLRNQEFVVKILTDGQVYSITHTLDEESGSANLTKSQAQEIAMTFLGKSQKYDLKNYNIIESKEDKKPNRTDFTFTFENQTNKISGASLRSVIHISGNEISGYYQYIKIPEDWIRENTKTALNDFFALGVITLGGFYVFILILNTFFQNIKNKSIQFKKAFKTSGFILIVVLLALLNELPAFYSNYHTAIPLSYYQIETIVMMLVKLIINFLSIAVLVGLAVSIWQQQIGKIIPQQIPLRNNYFKDALIIGFTIPFITAGLSGLLKYLYLIAGISFYPELSSSPVGMDHYYPFISVISSLPVEFNLFLLAVIIPLTLLKYLKYWRSVILFIFIFLIFFSVPGQKSLEDFLFNYINFILIILAAIFIISSIVRKNLLAYFLILYVNVIFFGCLHLLIQPELLLKINGAILIVILLLPLLIYFIWQSRLSDKFKN